MPAPACDLILLSWNHLEETRPCLESLFRTTTVPSRLLIVDNASEPPVRAYLRTIRPRGAIQEVLLLQNDTNEGFPRGMNRGIRASRAPYVCLLNNDLVFTEGWLDGLLATAEAHPSVGVLNPTSNTFGSRPAPGVTLEQHAARLRAQGRGFVEVGMCTGFCMLMTRAVLDRVGLLSEEVDRCFFEDEDFSMRAQQAKFQCVVVAGAYVYHAEHRSVRALPEREALFRKNQRWCQERWGCRLRLAWPRFAPAEPGSEELRGWCQRLTAWARRRTHVYIFSPLPGGATRNSMFQSVGLVPHADIRWFALPQPAARWAAIARILARRKKRFDLLVAPEPPWGRLMDGLRWLHGACIVPEPDEDQLVAQWRRLSRSPSSS